jgi:hypothetical protein
MLRRLARGFPLLRPSEACSVAAVAEGVKLFTCRALQRSYVRSRHGAMPARKRVHDSAHWRCFL